MEDLSGSKQSLPEPPSVSTSIPFIGHVIGVIRNKYTYYIQLSRQVVSPIFTMTMMGTKMYIVTTSEMIQAIQKQPKVLAFPPVAAKFTSKICGDSTEGHQILMTNVNGDDGNWGLSMESHEVIRATLAPGPNLDEMNYSMIQNITTSLDSLKPASGEQVTIELGKWLSDHVTAATTNSVYGAQNPFKDPVIANGFWQFENSLMAFLAGLFPALTARKGVAGRERLVKAFEHYFQIQGHKNGSSFVRDRYNVSVKNGLSIQDLARYEVVYALAILANTPPTIFWMIYFIYSRTNLLEDLRREIESIVTTSTNEIPITRSIDVTNAKANCPLLASTYQEVLRQCSIGTSIREVRQDTVLNGQWLLKKDALIQMPSSVIHRDRAVWGSDVDEFNPRRFMKDEKAKTENGKQPHPAAFRAYGGGTTLCPGRHFATTEILAVVTMFVMRYDLTPTAGDWSMPTTEQTKQAAIILEPDHDIEVTVSARKGFEDGRWAFGLKNSGMIFAMVTEDAEQVDSCLADDLASV